MTPQPSESDFQGILLVNKIRGRTAFHIVACLRRILGVKKIGHAGTLDPFATGVMVMLIGKTYTKLSDQMLTSEKEYVGRIRFGETTDTFDCEGNVIRTSDAVPTLAELERVLLEFQGEVEQIPPMFSAKKQNGKKLYELARQGKTVERKPVLVKMQTRLVHYEYPYAVIDVICSKGTYIRSIANDIGDRLACGGHLVELQRTRSGSFTLDQCFNGELLQGFKSEDIPQLREQIRDRLLTLKIVS